MTDTTRFPVGADGKAPIQARCYPAGSAHATSRGDPAWAGAAEEALRASLVFLPGISGRHFASELERRGVPVEVALEYLRTVSVLNEVYVTYRPGEEPETGYTIVGIDGAR